MRLGCDAPATCVVCFRVWPVGYPRGSTFCAEARTGLVLCEPHARGVFVSDVLDEDNRRKVLEAFRAAGRQEPDFATCEVFYEPLN